MTMRQDDMNPMQITDGAIREMFDRRSRQADAEDLRAMILAATVGERQRRGWYGVLRSHSPSGPARVLVLALITIAAVVGAVAGAAALRDDLEPRATAANFVRPFDFVMPAAGGLRMRVGKSAMVAWTSGPDLSPPPPPDNVSGGRQPSPSEQRGIIVGSAEAAWSHGGGGRFTLKTDPHEFLTDLHDIAGVQMSEITRQPWGATGVDRDVVGAGGTDIHVSGGMQGLGVSDYALLTIPSRLTVADIDGVTVFVLVWALTAEDLD